LLRGFADLSNRLRCSFDHAADAGSWRHMVRYRRGPRRMQHQRASQGERAQML